MSIEYDIKPVPFDSLNEDEQNLYSLCDLLAKELSQKYSLGYRRIIPVSSEMVWGRCNFDGFLEICFYKKLVIDEAGNTRRWSINRNEVLRTLCHELAHLKHAGHMEPFWRFCNHLIDDVNEITGFRVRHEQNVYQHSGK